MTPKLLVAHLLGLLGLALTVQASQYWRPKLLGSFYLKDAAFVEAFENPQADEEGDLDKFTLYFTTFNFAALFIHDPVYRLQSPGKLLDSVETWDGILEKLGGANTAFWPNQPVEIPQNVSGFRGIVQTSGFLVPGKTEGQLEVYNEETLTGPWNLASQDQTGWSYHTLLWHDMDNDNLLDVFTARFHVNVFGQTKSQLVWMKNPGNLGVDGENWKGWQQFVLIDNGPDVVISLHTFQYENKVYSGLITGELWTERIMLYYVEDVPGAWSDPTNIQSVLIDDQCGQAFEANGYDLNTDGKVEIVATCTKGGVGSLYTYLMPEDFRQGSKWERRTLAADFKPSSILNPNSMTPGKFKIFYPSLEYGSQTTEDGRLVKPWISLSGDDDGKHYLLYPESEDINDWNYTLDMIIDTGGDTSGTMALADLDGDGFMELISAGYSANTVYVHTFKQ